MTGFLVIGAIGLVLVVGSLVLGDVFEGLFDSFDIDAGGGLFSTPVIGTFLAALGFTAALTMSATGAPALVGLAAGTGAGVALGAAALKITRALMRMNTDEPVRVGDMVGASATVVSPIPEGGFGEVTLVHHGQRMKLHARASSAVPTGTSVVVVAVNSPSSVFVEREHEFWGPPASLEQGD